MIRIFSTVILLGAALAIYVVPVPFFLQILLSFVLSVGGLAVIYYRPTSPPQVLYEEVQPTVLPTYSTAEFTQRHRTYLEAVYGLQKTELMDLAAQIPQMLESCKLSINLPAYREARTIYLTLFEYTVKQKTPLGEFLSPNLFEINVLLNRPQPTIPFDEKTEQEILRFKKNYPQYRINLLKKTFHFDKNPLMGTIYKTLADLAIYRNLQRHDSHQQERLILRTGGADAREKNPLFLFHSLEIFKNPKLAVYRSESRYPQAVLEKCPLLHVLYTLESALNRVYTKGHSNVGLGSYLADIYVHAGGFNSQLAVAEEIDLAKRITETITRYPEKYVLKRDLRKNALDNPRRAIWALYTRRGMANKYNQFGEKSVEKEIQERDWQALLLDEKLPEYLFLTPENLSRETSFYFRYYLTRVRLYAKTLQTFKKSHPTATQEEVRQQTYRVTQKIFHRVFTHLGIKSDSYQFIQRDLNRADSQAQILFFDVSRLQTLLERRTFKSHRVFVNGSKCDDF